MSAAAPSVLIRGTTYPVLLPKLRDPRLHLAATIISLQVIGQIGFHFEVSIAQILLSLGTCAVLEMAIALRTQRVIMWPASAMLTGNGVAFVLRVPGTAHADWWSLRGWWIFVGTAAISLLSKHVIKWRGEHIFNPSNIGLVICFLALGRNRAAPLDFWWGPMSAWLVVALVVIVTGGFAILRRLSLLRVALGFWASFTLGIGVLALAGHSMTARWHLGPLSGFHLWTILITSPEVLVFLFFMITDPKTAPRSPTARVVYAVSLGLVAAVLIAPTTTEFAAKVALLGALAIVCAAMPILRLVRIPASRRIAYASIPVALAAAGGAIVLGNAPASATAARTLPPGVLPQITILPSHGVQTKLDLHTAQLIAHDLLAVEPATQGSTLKIGLQQGVGQGPPTATAQLDEVTYRLVQTGAGHWTVLSQAAPPRGPAGPTSDVLAGVRLHNIAPAVGLDFRQGSFGNGVTPESQAMMGGGLCWLDYNGDGWEDLFVVNSYASGQRVRPSALFENVHGRFHNVTAALHAGLPVQGNGCAAADLDGDGRPDLVVSTTSGVDVLWNRPGGFVRQTLWTHGWYAGVAVADVNGDGRPDIFVAGYSDTTQPVPNSFSGFPTNVAGVRDLLFLNEGGGRFREVGRQAGLDVVRFRHGLGATFIGRDLYVANDEDPNELYVEVPWPGGVKADPLGLGFRYEDRAVAQGVADPYAGMGIAVDGGSLVVTNSRGEPTAAFRRSGDAYADARPSFDTALGDTFAGWGASFVDLANTGIPDLVLTAGAIPVTNLAKDAEPVKVLAPLDSGSSTFGVAAGVLAPMRLNGRGLAAADVGNDGRMDVAINSIGGKLVLLQPSGPSGHWLDVALSRFSPGAIVTATLPDGSTQTRTVTAGSSYLSSEDPRVHFGLGAATRVARLTVRTPWGAVRTLSGVRADRVLTVSVPAPQPVRTPAVSTSCTPVHVPSIATYWDRAAVAALQAGGASEPVQARDLYDVSQAMWNAWTTSHSPAAVSYAAYRVLVWDASFDSNLSRTFGILESELRALCLSPGDTTAAGNRIAASIIAAGGKDGSLQVLHYTDTSFTSTNQPLVVSQPGSTVEDATFWQPLSFGAGRVQTFVGSQWGLVRTFAGTKLDVAAPKLGDPSSRAYKRAAIAVIRATSGTDVPTAGTSPLAWNRIAAAAAPRSTPQLYLALNGALNDAAVAAWRAKRRYLAPRPISMIRYLAFNRQLPIVPGLTKLDHGSVLVLEGGKWVPGAGWSPPAQTPASPGYASEGSAFAYAANAVLSALLGRPFDKQAQAASTAGVARGIDLPVDVSAGRRIGISAGKAALRRMRELG